MPASVTAFGSYAATGRTVSASERSYNPLSVGELGRNAVRALLGYSVTELPPQPPFAGGGVYAVYYQGPFIAYSALDDPIYVGKADRLYGRLTDHAASIDAAQNIDLASFGCRWLVLEPVWITLTEQILIDQYEPIWNRTLKGFGNHHQGRSRTRQARSQWDTVHPGRHWAAAMKPRDESAEELLERVVKHRRGET